MDKFGLNQTFRLNPGERVMVRVTVRISRLHEQGELSIFQKKIEAGKKTVIGGITFIVQSAKNQILSAPRNLRVLSF